MIYPDISPEKWIQKYPGLEMVERNCDSCGTKMKAERPFLMKDYAGLVAPICKCGKNKRSCMSMVTTTPEAHSRWAQLLGNL